MSPNEQRGFPVLQISLPDGRTISVVPGDMGAFFAGTLIEDGHIQPIGRSEVERLAAILGTPATRQFDFDVHNTIFCYAVMIAHGWLSPRWLDRFYKELGADPAGATARYKNVPFAAMIIRAIEQEVRISSPFDFERAFRLTVRNARDDIKRLIRPGRRNDRPEALVFQHITKMVRRLTGDLRLPSRDDTRGGAATTRLFEFADAMRLLLVEAGQRLDPTRFGEVAHMTRDGLIAALERAKEAVAAESP